MSPVKDPSLFGLAREFLVSYLPEVRRCSPNTIRAYRTVLNQFLDFAAKAKGTWIGGVSFDDFTGERVLAFLSHVEGVRKCSVGTRNHRLNCLRSFLAFAAQMDAAAVSAKGSLDTVPYKNVGSRPIVKHLGEKALSALLAAPDADTPSGRRDRTILALMYDAAARVQEVANVTLCDMCLGQKPSLTLRGKGGKTRVVPLMPNTVKLLLAYVAEFHPDAKANPRANLFFSKYNGVRNRMTEDNIRKIVRHYGTVANKSTPEVSEKLHPHTLRHSRAMHLYQNGMDLEILSQWLGHERLETTLIYANADAEMKRKAIEAATPADSPLGKHLKPKRMTISDEALIRRLYGLEQADYYQENAVTRLCAAGSGKRIPAQ